MSRFYGKIGYGESVEIPDGSGVWVDEITEVEAFGNVIRPSRQLRENQRVNSDITVGNSISVVRDERLTDHIFELRYVFWEGTRWIIENVDVVHPRLIFRLGGVYNGPTPE